MVKYLHAVARFPTEDTWYKAVKAGNFITWPGLTTEAVRKHFQESDKTQQGHMKTQRQGVRSTRTKTAETEDVPIYPKKMKDVYMKIHNASKIMQSNQTGCFPATSSKGNQYIIVLVEVDGNYIDAEPMKNKTEGSMNCGHGSQHQGQSNQQHTSWTTKHWQHTRLKPKIIAQYS